MNVDEEIGRLKTEIVRLGTKNADGSITVKFGTLFNDERCANIFEALVGTLRAAKKRKIVTFNSEMLFQGVHNNVDIVLVKLEEETSVAPKLDDAVIPKNETSSAPKDDNVVVKADDVIPKDDATTL